MNTTTATEQKPKIELARVLEIIDAEQKTNAAESLVVALLERIKNQILKAAD